MTVVIDCEHYSVDLDPHEEWVTARCSCGWQNGPYPSIEDACDALMEHAYEAGRRAASNQESRDVSA